MFRERSSYNLPYQKQAQSTWLSLRVPKTFKTFTLFAATALFLVTFLSFYKNTYRFSSTKPLINLTGESQNNNEHNIIVVVDGEKQGSSLQPIFCNLSSRSNINTHVIVIGQEHGIGKSLLTKLINKHNSSCEVLIYDLVIKTNNELSISEFVFQGISHALNKIQPDVILYVKDHENPAIRGVDSALAATPHLHTTVISAPIEDINHLSWLADLPIESLRHWHKPRIHLQVITQDRPDSLARLIRSLKSSYYFGDEVTLTINMDKAADPVTKEYCRSLEWSFGRKDVRHRIVQGGLMAAVVESYYPGDDNDYAVLLEDDVELSPYFYVWTKYNILKYRYGPDRKLSNRMYGISYYGSKIDELYLGGRRPFDPAIALEGTIYPSRSPFLWQTPCSWGAVFFPEVWREFHDYLPARIEDLNGPNLQNITVPESRSNAWSRSWKRFLTELVYLRGYLMLYPNYENYVSFSTNHAEAGTHMRQNMDIIFGVPLMEEDKILSGLPGGRTPDYKDLPILDLTGNLISKEELIQRGRSLISEVSNCPPSPPSDDPTFDPQDILCMKMQDDINELTPEGKKEEIPAVDTSTKNETITPKIDNDTQATVDSSNSTSSRIPSIETNTKS